MFSLLTRAALLCAAAALLAPARAAEMPELDPDTDPICKELAHSCVTELDAEKLQTKLMPYGLDILIGTNKEATTNEVRSTLAEVFETCMDGANSCCCCDENMKTAIEKYFADVVKEYGDSISKDLGYLLPDDFSTDPMQCSHRPVAYTCSGSSGACPARQSCSEADATLKCNGDAVQDDANHCAGDLCVSSDFGGVNTRCCSAPGSCEGVTGVCTGGALRNDSGTCAKPVCGPDDFGTANANCCQPAPQSCSASGAFDGECVNGAVKDDSGTCSTHACGTLDYGAAGTNCCTTPQNCGSSTAGFSCTGGAVKNDSGTCAGKLCQPDDFGTADANCCQPPPQSCSASGAFDGECTGGAVKNGLGTCATTCDSSDYGGVDKPCCAPPQSCSAQGLQFTCSPGAYKDASGTCAGLTCTANDFGQAGTNCCASVQSCSAADVTQTCTGGAVRDDSAKCETDSCGPSDFGGADKPCCTAPQSCGDADVTGTCQPGAVKDDTGVCAGPTCGAADFGGADKPCCTAPQSCGDADVTRTCKPGAVKDDTGVCAGPKCRAADFGGPEKNCCKAAITLGWRVSLNATWTGSSCRKVLKLIPMLKSQPDFKAFGPMIDEDAMSCVDFGKCVDDKCPSSVLFMTKDQQADEDTVKGISSMAESYSEVPSDIQKMQSFITYGELAGFAAPTGLLCVDDDCKKRKSEMPDTCRACTCAGKDGKASPCKVEISISASHSELTVAAFTDLTNAAASFADVDSTMVTLSLKSAGKISMSVWLEDSSKAAELSTKTIADLKKGSESTLSMSIAKAVVAQNKDGIKVASVETEAPEARESKYNNDMGVVGNGEEESDASNGGAVEEGGGNVGAIIGTVVGVVAALAIGGVWLMWVQKKKENTSKSPGGMGNDFAIGVLESGTGTGVTTTQMIEIRGKRVSMANPLNTGAASQENELGLSPAMEKQGWASAVDDEGDMYYYNHKQGVSTYDVPVYKNGSWVALSEDEEEDDDEDDGGIENGGTGRLAAQISKKKPSLLVHNTRKMATTNKNVKAKKSMSMAVVRKKKHSSLGGGETDNNRINKRSQSLAVNTSKSNAPDSRWERKKKLLSQPAIPIVNEEVEEEALVLTAAMKKSGWKTATDDDGDEYFYNHTRGESTYELPVLKDGAFVAPSDDETDDESD